ncbi:MAG TPA: phenylacetic acid degradation protein PaaN [Chitinophagales bacterium]|nr:phenylacetic acid degradation protein PaaN [Chitinophagales bacterium]
MALSAANKEIVDKAVKAIHERTFYAQYPEHPKAYGEDAPGIGLSEYNNQLGKAFNRLLQQNPVAWEGEEVSPYTLKPLGVTYPVFEVETLVVRAGRAFGAWKNVSVDDRAEILVEALEKIKYRFFEIAYSTHHTTGQSFIMSFQASGPHASDRALEALAAGYEELTRFPGQVTWEKPMGKTSVKLQKEFKAVPKGISLVIGCSTFPIWNSVPGIFASLITGNPVIVKPHPKSVYPIAIVVAEIQHVLQSKGLDPNICQLAADSSKNLITKKLAEHPLVKLIDYTGSSEFGSYIESIPGKTTFTEKAGVNSVIIDSVSDLKAVVQNLGFAVSLYSGQMCTAPQNFFIPAGGVKQGDTVIPYDDVKKALVDAISGLVNHPQMGPGTPGAIQNENTVKRVNSVKDLDVNVLLQPVKVVNPDFPEARTTSPIVLEVDAKDKGIYENELFGPIVLIIKTKDTGQSVELAKEMVAKHGAITCAAYATDEDTAKMITEEMESVFAPVSLNLTGMIWVNQHAGFSDFHVTGGNPAGNASFTNPEYVSKRFVWVGHRRVA